MSDLFLIPILTFITAIASLITAREVLFIKKENGKPREVFKKTESKKKLSMSGRVLIFCALATVGLSYWQQLQNKSDVEKANRQAQIDLDKRDSLSNFRLEKSKNETIEVLARYGLKYDSAKTQIITFIKDSSGVKYKASVGICLDEAGFNPEGGGDQEMNFRIHICNYGQDLAYDFDMGIGAVVKKPSGVDVQKLAKIPNGVRISSQTRYPVRIILRNVNYSTDTVFFFLKGTYSSGDKMSDQPITEFLKYNDQSLSVELQDDKTLLKYIRNISFK